MNFQPGNSIGEYKIIQFLGEGSFGEVYLAEWNTNRGKKQGALKVLKKQPNVTLEEEFGAILDEVTTWGRVSQGENIVTFLGAKRYQGQFFILSEYVRGGALDDWLKTNGGKAPTIETAIKLMAGILNGLEHLHENDIIHRDIKPANVMLRRNGTPLLADFGMARGLSLVQSSVLAGTQIYFAPEIAEAWIMGAQGTKIKRTEQHDLWAAAVIFQQLLTGDYPFDTLYKIWKEPPAPLPAGFPSKWQAIMNRAFAKDPTQRFESAAKMCAAIKEAYYGPQLAQTVKSRSGQLQTFSFTSVQLDEYGKEVKRWQGQGQQFTVNIAGVPMELVLVQPGRFYMGDDRSHEVTIGYPFYLGKYPVTREQWAAVATKLEKITLDLNANPSYNQEVTDRLPVEQVSWEMAQEFCARIRKAAGHEYLLPSEAEWEYACRAGTTTPFAFGATITPEIVNYDGDFPYAKAQKGKDRTKTIPVGSLGVANPWGFYDMHGNVWEWCEDIWNENYNNLLTDGSPNVSVGDSSERLLRGGSRVSYGNYCRSAYRYRSAPDSRYAGVAFALFAVAKGGGPINNFRISVWFAKYEC